jgi:hypothetical protein
MRNCGGFELSFPVVLLLNPAALFCCVVVQILSCRRLVVDLFVLSCFVLWWLGVVLLCSWMLLQFGCLLLDSSEHLDPINVKIGELREALESIITEQKYLKARDARHRNRKNTSNLLFCL